MRETGFEIVEKEEIPTSYPWKHRRTIDCWWWEGKSPEAKKEGLAWGEG